MAEMQSNAERNDQADTNQRLQSQLQQMVAENGQLRTEIDSTRRKHQTDTDQQKQELERLQKTHELEVTRLSNEIRQTQKEVEMKSAALQSLKLAKPVGGFLILNSYFSPFPVLKRRLAGTRSRPIEA
jgi:hypothetical protein